MEKQNKKNLKKISLSISIVVFCVFNFQTLDFARAADEIAETQDKIESIEKKLEKEKQALNAATASYSKVTAQVSTTSKLIVQTETEISRKEAEIKNLNDRIALYKNILSAYLQEVYFSDQDPIIKLATNENFDKVFGNVDQMVNTKEKILGILDEIEVAQEKLGEVKEELAEKKEDHEKLLQQKKAEQGEIIEDIQEAKATIGELQKKLAEMQSDLAVLTGKSYNAKDIREAVEFASKNTGVPRGVLYGFLKMETNLGANTGQCTYEQVEKVAVARYKKYGSKYKASIALLYKRRDIFYALVDDLGYNKSKKVSCSPSGYIGQGGAMGVAQFMSDVWNSYSPQVSSKTGHRVPDPWNLTDGVMAMAIKLQKAGATSDSSSAIKRASINYLGTYYPKYYEGIVYWSKNYKTLFPD